MSLPLTLAVLDGMVVTIANETLVIPLTAIVETLQPKPAAVPWVRRRYKSDRDS
jgi:two-component system chemotaxis sensor kinase CheA